MFNIGSLIGSLGGGARGKPHTQVSLFLGGGNKSFINAGNLMTAAALGFGAY